MVLMQLEKFKIGENKPEKNCIFNLQESKIVFSGFLEKSEFIKLKHKPRE